jgi:hypothetical protein
MMRAEEARKETDKYLKNPFDFETRELQYFEDSFLNYSFISSINYNISESCKKNKYSVCFKINFNDYLNNYKDSICYELFKRYQNSNLDGICKYLKSKNYSVNITNINKKILFLFDKIIGFTFEISWKDVS